jgi:acyl CoA:acetate/3-ketoacid CoA transferase alpha subunit
VFSKSTRSFPLAATAERIIVAQVEELVEPGGIDRAADGE